MRRVFLATLTAYLLFALSGTAQAAGHKVALNLRFDNGTTNVRLVAQGTPLKGSGHMINSVVYPMYVTSGYVVANTVHLTGTMTGKSGGSISWTLVANRVTRTAVWTVGGTAKQGKGTVSIQ